MASAFSFLSFSSLSAFLPAVPLPFYSVFLAYTSFVLWDHVSLHAALLFLHPLSAHSLLLRASLPPLRLMCFGRLFFFFCVHRSRLRCFISCFLPSGSVCSLVTCFSFICVFLASLCSVLSRSSCPSALFRGTHKPTCLAASTLSLWVLCGQRGTWVP